MKTLNLSKSNPLDFKFQKDSLDLLNRDER